MGPRARAFGARPHIENDGEIHIGPDFAASSEFGTLRIAAGRRASVRIGAGVTVNYGTAISARAAVTIGSGVKIGPFCIVADTEVPLPLPDDEPPRPIVIGDGVWLGARVIVLPGATIGAGAIVSAGSVVSGTIPAGAIAAGSPARVLRVTGHAAAS